jgi:NAD(P)-dependent dehydrogenase (short-subunit alcohol dehydrogenase family)
MRKVVVTGANKGIGLALVSAILEHAEDTFVYLGSRDADRGRAARDSLVTDHAAWADRLEVLPLDVTDDDSVRAASASVSEALGEGETLYGVVNNAGVGRTAGMAGVLDVNTRGMRRVSEAFVPLLPQGGRVVNVTSASGPMFVAKCSDERKATLTNPDVSWSVIDDIMNEAVELAAGDGDFSAAGLGNGDPYGISKACGNAYTLLLAREQTKLLVNACTPGYIETDMTRPYAEASGRTPDDMGMKSPKEGTRAPMFLLFGDPPGNGRYYGSDAERSPLDRYRSPGDPPYEGP